MDAAEAGGMKAGAQEIILLHLQDKPCYQHHRDDDMSSGRSLA